MSLLLTFTELDKLYEHVEEDKELQQLINKINNTTSGKHYKLSGRKRSKGELLSILTKCLEKDKQLVNKSEVQVDSTKKGTICKTGLSPEGRCPKCDPDFGIDELD